MRLLLHFIFITILFYLGSCNYTDQKPCEIKTNDINKNFDNITYSFKGKAFKKLKTNKTLIGFDFGPLWNRNELSIKNKLLVNYQSNNLHLKKDTEFVKTNTISYTIKP